MAQTTDVVYVQEFNDNLKLLAQQRLSRFRPYVSVGSAHGEQMSPVDQLGEATVEQRNSRYEPKGTNNIPHSRRWVLPTSYSSHLPEDDFDKLRKNVQLGSGYLKAQMQAMNRKMDDSAILGIFGDNQTGKSGTTTESWDTGYNIAVGTTDLTVTKLLAARQLLLEGDIDLDDPEEMIGCGITPHQENTLINSDELNNADYGNTVFDKARGLHGRTWFGITFFITNRLTGADFAADAAGASADREIPFFAKSGVHLGLWDDLRGTIVPRNDLKGEPMEMSTYATFGFTRIEQKKVIKIICKET